LSLRAEEYTDANQPQTAITVRVRI